MWPLSCSEASELPAPPSAADFAVVARIETWIGPPPPAGTVEPLAYRALLTPFTAKLLGDAPPDLPPSLQDALVADLQARCAPGGDAACLEQAVSEFADRPWTDLPGLRSWTHKQFITTLTPAERASLVRVAAATTPRTSGGRVTARCGPTPGLVACGVRMPVNADTRDFVIDRAGKFVVLPDAGLSRADEQGAWHTFWHGQGSHLQTAGGAVLWASGQGVFAEQDGKVRQVLRTADPIEGFVAFEPGWVGAVAGPDWIVSANGVIQKQPVEALLPAGKRGVRRAFYGVYANPEAPAEARMFLAYTDPETYAYQPPEMYRGRLSAGVWSFSMGPTYGNLGDEWGGTASRCGGSRIYPSLVGGMGMVLADVLGEAWADGRPLQAALLPTMGYGQVVRCHEGVAYALGRAPEGEEAGIYRVMDDLGLTGA